MTLENLLWPSGSLRSAEHESNPLRSPIVHGQMLSMDALMELPTDVGNDYREELSQRSMVNTGVLESSKQEVEYVSLDISHAEEIRGHIF
jgi:hypothetical protein